MTGGAQSASAAMMPEVVCPSIGGHRLAPAYGPQTETFFVPGAEHVSSYHADTASYPARLTSFFDEAEGL
jgi:hypothetical protein